VNAQCSKPHVLLVTNKDDFAVDFLIYRLKDTSVPYFRLNSDNITDLGITYDLHDTTIKCQNFRVSLCALRSVYFRRAPTVFPESIIKNDTPFINRERRDFFEGLYLSYNRAKWINPIFATYIAERKLYQLFLAKKIGFNIPKTIVSNDPMNVNEFMKEQEASIIKPISHGLQISNEGVFSIYTSEIKDTQRFANSDELFEAPVLVQERISNYRDIRVTVVGHRIFPVEIEKEDDIEVDWRKPDIKKIYKRHKLPSELENKIYSLQKELNLIYSAVDFILTPNGEYIFLETNPAGEWVWLERELGLDISGQIIDELIG